MGQTREEMTQNPAERLCWEVARWDDARVARLLWMAKASSNTCVLKHPFLLLLALHTGAGFITDICSRCLWDL
jgi:hypothetical protein